MTRTGRPHRARVTRVAAVVAVALAGLPPALAQDPAARDTALAAQVAPVEPAKPDSAPAAPRERVPDSVLAKIFAIGERLEYDVSLGGIGVGKGSMQLVGTDTVRGHHVLRTVFIVKGGIPFFHVNDVLESWFDPATMISYRFIQRIHEGGYHPLRIYQIYPERGVFQQEGRAELPTVAEPLDDGAFFYFVRTVPLVVGKTYTFTRYFIPEKNPVIVKVLRRDTVKVPAGKFATVVVQPIIKSGGVFADGGEALMWLSDDDRHMLVQMKVKTSIPVLKSLNLYLRSFTPGAVPAPDSSSRPPPPPPPP